MTIAEPRATKGCARPEEGAARKTITWPRHLPVLRLCLVAAALYSCDVGSVHAEALAPATATAFIEETADHIVAIIDGHDSASSQAAKLQAVVDGAVDIEGIAKFCMGRYWASSSAAQRQAFLGLFHAVLLDGVTGQIRNYKGVTVKVGRVQAHDPDISVSSVVDRPEKGPARVDWLVEATQSGLKIEDVVAEGTSLRLTRRNDYATYLGSHNGSVDALLDAMRQRLAQQ